MGLLWLLILRRQKSNFVACDNYPNCKNTYSLPPGGLIKKTDKICEFCGFPMLMSIRKGKTMDFCFNSECESNKKRLEEYKLKNCKKANFFK